MMTPDTMSDDAVMLEVGRRVRAIATLRGYATDALARDAGVPVKKMPRVMAGKTNLTAPEILRVAHILNARVSDLFGTTTFDPERGAMAA